MSKVITLLAIGFIFATFAAAAYGQQFVPASMTGAWEDRWVSSDCNGGLEARVKMDPLYLENGGNGEWMPTSGAMAGSGKYVQWIQFKNQGDRTLIFAFTWGETAAEANKLVVQGDLVDPNNRITLKPGEMSKAYQYYVKNPAGMFFSVGYISRDSPGYISPNGTAVYNDKYERCYLKNESDDPFCLLRPVDGCPNFSKIKEERAKIIKDPENEVALENPAFKDLPANGPGTGNMASRSLGNNGSGTQSNGGGAGGTDPRQKNGSGSQSQDSTQQSNASSSQGQKNSSGSRQAGTPQDNASHSYRYDSICARNFRLLEKRTAGKEYSAATYDLFYRDSQKLFMDMAQPCMSYDPEMKRIYDATADLVNKVDQYCARPHDETTCTQWGWGDDRAGLNQRWFNLVQAEARGAITDPNYSNELDGSVRPAPGSSSGGGTGSGYGGAGNGSGGNGTGGGQDGGSGTGSAVSGPCQSGLDQLEQEFAGINARRPQSNSIIPDFQTALYMTSKMMDHLQKNCQGQPQYKQYDSYKTAYDQTLAACKGSVSDVSVCVAKIGW